MDYVNDFSWNEFDISTPRLPGSDSQRSDREASPPDAGSCSEPEPVHSDGAERLPLLRLCDVETDREYNRENPTCIHYDLKLKVSLRGAGKKRSSQVDLLNKSDVILAPSALWDTELQAHLATLLSNPDIFPTGSNFTCQGGAVSIKAKTTRSGLDDTFNGDDIPWSKVDEHLESLGLLFKLRRMQITVMVDLTYHETSTKAAAGAKRRTTTSIARAKLRSDAAFMTRVYRHHECNGICRNKSMHCLKDKDGNHHAIDLETMRVIYDEIKQRVGENENFEDVQDIEVPERFHRKIIGDSKKRKACADIDSRNRKTNSDRGDGYRERLEVPGNPEQKMTEYCTFNLNVQSDRHRSGMEAANRVALDELLDLATVHQYQQAVKERMLAKGVPLGSALRFIEGVAPFVASQETDGEE
ncbi:hypothetical protein PWT90_07396 [Aphanocladium album]|nr:hypothetical protein PWT90_07396 [Aphanocladium album]